MSTNQTIKHTILRGINEHRDMLIQKGETVSSVHTLNFKEFCLVLELLHLAYPSFSVNVAKKDVTIIIPIP